MQRAIYLHCSAVQPGSLPGIRVRGPEKPQQEDWLHNLQGSMQNENVGSFVQEFQDNDSRTLIRSMLSCQWHSVILPRSHTQEASSN